MLTIEDINKLIQAMKSFFYSKEEMDVKFESMESKFSNLQTSVDAFAKTVSHNDEEVSALGDRVDGIESWVKESVMKIEVEYKT